ncbi:phosphatidylinositol alpha-mannosyltransferase, partial [Vibrio parahaemolyticus]
NGIDEVVRIKGTASIHTDSNLLSVCPDGSKSPKVVIKIVIESMYFHCAKAVMRGKLWSDDYKVNRSILSSLAQIFKDQQNLESNAISQDEMVKYYESSL